jgi:predicted nucleotidyltransferase
MEPAATTLIEKLLAEQTHPLVFSSLSGAHIYGFPSPDSDYDVRALHVLPLENILSLKVKQETLQHTNLVDGVELDFESHDLLKFCQILLKKNCVLLEQLLSPIVFRRSPAFEELVALVPDLLTCHHAHHYLGLADTQWKLVQRESAPRVKPLLYVFRSLLTGIYLMRTGQLVMNILDLNQHFKLAYIEELVACKTQGSEQERLASLDLEFYTGEFERLKEELRAARKVSHLPEVPSGYDALNDFLVRTRLAYAQSAQTKSA